MNFSFFIFALLNWLHLTQGGCSRMCFFHTSSSATTSFYPWNLDAKISSLCSHLIIGFAYTQGFAYPRIIYHPKLREFMPRFSYLKNAGLKILLQLLNYQNNLDDTFYEMIKSPAKRRIFIDNAVAELRASDFDGVTVREKIINPLDNFRSEYLLFLQELAAAFRSEAARTGRPKLLLFASLYDTFKVTRLDVFSDVNGICREVDMVILETQALRPNSPQKYHAHHSRLYGEYPEDSSSINYMTNYVISKGCAKEKLIISITPTVSAYWEIDPEAEFNKQFVIFATIENYKICPILRSGYTVHRLEDKSPYLIGPRVDGFYYYFRGNFLYYYEDEDSIKVKVDYIKQKGLGGIHLWEISNDDFANRCNRGQYPILTAINRDCR
ncbi:chitotriosidase-1-like [Biomphalaria glabrata]|uniref:Chitotriosidase-1-like n=1 Tax=Biomphalaria glabrata TaxID=6526 RepID=A0A9W2YKC1_BIOGL|nr:chitotriosidase-1-like [Biomphalaria glabrata]